MKQKVKVAQVVLFKIKKHVMSFKVVKMNAARICDGLSKIGYTTYAAICDIIDNSVQHNSKNIEVVIIRSSIIKKDTVKNNVDEYIIIDDGDGMNEADMEKALELGSSPDDYGAESLSKFGLGLKSASFSQGEILEVISRKDKGSKFSKRIVSLPEIRKRQEYGVLVEGLNTSDQKLCDKYLKNKTGTIIRIKGVRKINHAPLEKTLETLETRLGVIYYYYMIAKDFSMIIDGNKISPFDPLFVEKANINGDLDELNWDGKTVKWLHHPSEIILDTENKVIAKIEATNLIHPPSFKIEGGADLQTKMRKEHNIDSSNYGIYIYRNKRLISWAEHLDGIIPFDQNLYAFRARILLDESADESLNIDIKKSLIVLSDEAYDALDNLSSDLRRKSRTAWEDRAKKISELSQQSSHEAANEVVEAIVFPEEMPGDADDKKTLEEKAEREEKVNKKASVSGPAPTSKGKKKSAPISGDKGTEEMVSESRIKFVDYTTNAVLWEMYYDPSIGTCVKINKHHRFYQLIYSKFSENKQLSLIFDSFFFTLTEAEKYTIKSLTDIDIEIVTKVLETYREVSSNYLIKTAQSIDKIV